MDGHVEMKIFKDIYTMWRPDGQGLVGKKRFSGGDVWTMTAAQPETEARYGATANERSRSRRAIKSGRLGVYSAELRKHMICPGPRCAWNLGEIPGGEGLRWTSTPGLLAQEHTVTGSLQDSPVVSWCTYSISWDSVR